MDTLTISAFVVGATQLVKDYGLVQGRGLQLVAVAFGAFATYLSLYQPEIWLQLSSILLAVGATGTVSFVDERLK